MRPYRFASYRPYLEALEARLTMSGPGSNNPGILPLQSHAFGASYGEWSARWWQWAYSLPVDHALAATQTSVNRVRKELGVQLQGSRKNLEGIDP